MARNSSGKRKPRGCKSPRLRRWEVPVIYRGLDNFIVKASTAAEAKELARVKFNAGQAPDTLGNEWEAIEEIEEPQPLPDEENT